MRNPSNKLKHIYDISALQITSFFANPLLREFSAIHYKSNSIKAKSSPCAALASIVLKGFTQILSITRFQKYPLIIRANRALNVFKKARHKEGRGGVLGLSSGENILLHMVLAKNEKYVSSHWKFGTISIPFLKIFLKTKFENIKIFYRTFFLVECFLCFSGKRN